jgi:hypothetical protein
MNDLTDRVGDTEVGEWEAERGRCAVLWNPGGFKAVATEAASDDRGQHGEQEREPHADVTVGVAGRFLMPSTVIAVVLLVGSCRGCGREVRVLRQEREILKNSAAFSRSCRHASITVTIDRYGYLFQGNESQAAELLDAYLESALRE